ncbi:tyrosine-type recombinase/integrase [Streptomyces sp. ISL-43]|uniref:tyrosine-type recombinase/integrase n=1 Tax=Streptomyces sp. ISL-43 TaxID=2819183 RepID=UPI001BEA7EA6|nr:tyrosine-type recombinase/integrase [Streptomyces sp. ISL-43]MBT2450376.1 tyrosine-type recombinase/integrase [Streptomyces sp. ISL-43]
MSVDALKEERLISVEQVRSLLEWIRGQADGNRSVHPFLATVAEQALRPSEARTVRVHDVVLLNEGWGELTVRRGGVARVIPLQPYFVEFLGRWISEAGLQEDDLLFPGMNGGPLSVSGYQRLWRQAQEAVLPRGDLFFRRLGEPVSILRDSRLAEWLRLGISPFAVAEWAGVKASWLSVRYPHCFRVQGTEIDWDHLAEVMALPDPSEL